MEWVGIGGGLFGGKVTRCQNENNIEGSYNVGGIVGYANAKVLSNNFEITDCKNSGIVVGNSYNTIGIHSCGIDGIWETCSIGGIIGQGTKLKVTSCYNTNLVIGGKKTDNAKLNRDVGGIVGLITNSEITKCYNLAEIKGDGPKTGSVGGIVGSGFYNVKVNNSYNEGKISGYYCIGGIAGIGNMMDIRYCYNKGSIKAINEAAGGIVGWLQPYNKEGYENLIYYCYNRGSVIASIDLGSINGHFLYLDTDYVYSLEGVAQSNNPNNNWGKGDHYINATRQGIYNQENLTSTVLSEFGENFKQDYNGSESVNDGFPILSWQVQKSKMPK